MAAYYIAIPLGPGTEHMTLKYLGNLSDIEVEQWKQKMESLSNIQKFPVSSEGLGILGRYRPALVDYIKKNPRLNSAFELVDNTIVPPHVTNRNIVPEISGAISPMGTVVADRVNLYKREGSSHPVVYSVELKRRKPTTWVMDQLGLSKFGEDMYKESSVASWLEAGIGGIGSYLVAKRFLPPKEQLMPTRKQPYVEPTSDYRPAVIAGLSAIVSPILGRRLRANALAKLIHSRNTTLATHANMQNASTRALYKLRNQTRQGSLKMPGLPRSTDAHQIYENAFVPEVNNMLASRAQLENIQNTYNKSRNMHKILPFGLGTGMSREAAEEYASRYTKHHKDSGLVLAEDVSKLTGPRRKYVYDTIVGDGPSNYKDFSKRMRNLVAELS